MQIPVITLFCKVSKECLLSAVQSWNIIKCTNHGAAIAGTCVHSRVSSLAIIKRAYIQVMMRIMKKKINVLFKKTQFFLGIANYSLFLKQRLLNNKIPGSSTAADSPLAGFIHPNCQARLVPLISLHLYNNAVTIYFSHHS